MNAGEDRLPSWAVVSAGRRSHIRRVVALLTQWAAAMQLDPAETAAWIDAGWGHDALRGESDEALRLLTGDRGRPVELLHGPAAAARLAVDGETRADVLEAVRWHTVGYAPWARTGRALYMADFLEPGRAFLRDERAELAAAVPEAFEQCFRTVVQWRIEWAVRQGHALAHETVELWNSVA